MPKIDWKKKVESILDALHSGLSVKEVATNNSVSYSSLCTYLRLRSINNKGKFKDRIVLNTELKSLFNEFLFKKFDTMRDISEYMGLSHSRIHYIMAQFDMHKEWHLEDSTSENVRVGRKAELFVKAQPEFRVLKDMVKKATKYPYDLIIAGDPEHRHPIVGAVDVKSTHLREYQGGHRWKFDINNTRKKSVTQLKFIVCVGYDETFTVPQVMLIIPFRDVKGIASISFCMEKMKQSKYYKYLYKIYDESIKQQIV